MPAKREIGMQIKIDCPYCHEKIQLAETQAFRGNLVVCPHCAGQLSIAGKVLAQIFWSANQRGTY